MSNIPPGTYDLSGVKVAGSILSSPISAGSVVLAVLFLFVFLFAVLRGRPILAAVAGLLCGLFGGLDLIFGRVAGSGTDALALLPVALLVLGVVLALVRARAIRGGGGGGLDGPGTEPPHPA